MGLYDFCDGLMHEIETESVVCNTRSVKRLHKQLDRLQSISDILGRLPIHTPETRGLFCSNTLLCRFMSHTKLHAVGHLPQGRMFQSRFNILRRQVLCHHRITGVGNKRTEPRVHIRAVIRYILSIMIMPVCRPLLVQRYVGKEKTRDDSKR